jgi:phage tail sheath protein FI
MPASFLHGVEVAEVTTGPVPVQVVKSAVIGLVGAAPQWAVAATNPLPAPGKQKLTLVSSARDVSQFGPLIQGYSIPYALAAIQKQGAGQAIVIDVFDPSVHNTAVVSQPFSMPAAGSQFVNLGHMGIVGPGLAGFTGASSVVVKNQAGSTTYIEDTDYTVDYVNGIIWAKNGGSITVGEALQISFNYCDPSKVQDTDLVGAVNNGVYTGIQAFQLAYGSFGFFPKILIAPAAGIAGAGSQDSTVASALNAMAQTVRAMALVDSPPATQVAAAIASRGTSGNTFDTSSKRTVLCFPWVNFYDTGLVPTGVTIVNGAVATETANANADSPLSQWIAGVMAAQDLNKGYWWSPSNVQIQGIVGPDVAIYSSIIDPNADTNNLNAAGILTVFTGYGTGPRSWGNRSAAYPTSTEPDQFINIRRTLDIIEESAQLAMMQYLDAPITNALIDLIVASVNAFLRTLVARGALVDGRCSYDPSENPASQIAAGQLVFDIDVMPPPPAERMTFNVFIDTSLLSKLTGTVPQSAATQP